MAEAILSYPLNEVDYNAEDAMLYNSTRTNGVYSSDSHFVVTAVTNQPLQISVSSGLGWINYADFAGIVIASKSSIVFNLNTSHASLARIDRVVARFNIVTNQVEIDVITGTPSSSPVAPAYTRSSEKYELVLADITVRAGALTLTSGNITDRRLNETMCGIMRDGVTRIPTATLYAEWESWFNSLQTNANESANTFLEWIETFKTNNLDGLEEWISNFQSSITSNWMTWYSQNTTSFSEEFNTWFLELQSVLDENQAANLFNMINQHRNASLIANNSVHGMIFLDGIFMINDGIGWVPLATVQYGITYDYATSRQITANEFALLQMTADAFTNYLIRYNITGTTQKTITTLQGAEIST